MFNGSIPAKTELWDRRSVACCKYIAVDDPRFGAGAFSSERGFPFEAAAWAAA